MHSSPVTWVLAQSRKTFFDSFAMEQGFDPLVPENWYSIKQAQIRAHKVFFKIIGNSYS